MAGMFKAKTPSGIEPTTSRFLSLCVNQQRHSVPCGLRVRCRNEAAASIMEATVFPKTKNNVRQSRSNVKITLTVFFYCRSLVDYHFVPRGQKGKQEFSLNFYGIKEKQSKTNRRRSGGNTAGSPQSLGSRVHGSSVQNFRVIGCTATVRPCSYYIRFSSSRQRSLA